MNLLRHHLLLPLLFLSSLISAQPHAAIDTANLPKFYFKEGKVHDFGDVPDGDQPVYRFIFTNTGNTPLFITNIILSCECFNVDWSRYPIAPGKEGWISAQFPYTDHLGNFSKLLWIVSNAMVGTDREELMIKGKSVEGKVTEKKAAFYFLSPVTHNFGSIPTSAPVTYQFLYRNKGNTPLRISAIKSDCKCLSVDYGKAPTPPGRASWIKVTYTPGTATGSLHHRIWITSNAESKSKTFLELEGNILPW